MDIKIYSLLLTIGALALLAFAIFLNLSHKFHPLIISKFYKKYTNKFDNLILWLIALISGGSMVGALIYEWVYHTPPCTMCWWSRIALFPIFPITLLALKYKITNVSKIISTLSALGLIVVCYHYYFHFQIYVLNHLLTMPCDTNPLVPSCTGNSGVLVWGLFTIPAMGILTFLSMILIAKQIRE